MEYSEITQCKCENKYVLSKSSVHLKLWIVVLGGYMGVVKVFQRIQGEEPMEFVIQIWNKLKFCRCWLILCQCYISIPPQSIRKL